MTTRTKLYAAFEPTAAAEQYAAMQTWPLGDLHNAHALIGALATQPEAAVREQLRQALQVSRVFIL